MKPLILLANDDGIHARGLNALAERLADLGDLVVVAPDRERSATSHAFTLNRPLRVEEVRPGWFSVDGTPVDCVYIGVLKLVPRRPSLLVSGINHGFNLGSDVFYSGTVACAVEGAIRGIPSVAMSLDWHATDDFAPAADFAHAIAHAVLVEGLPEGTLLNVNVPEGPARRYRFTRLGKRLYRDTVDERSDLRGRRYYWIGGPPVGVGDVEGTDGHTISRGFVSVTPLGLDLTHGGLLTRLPGWRLQGFEAAVEAEIPEALLPGGDREAVPAGDNNGQGGERPRRDPAAVGEGSSMTDEAAMQLARVRMVEEQLRKGGIRDERVLGAMARVPRERFVEDHSRSRAYDDGPLPIPGGQTISQPWMVARMLELMALGGDETVLEIGAGSGYQSALLAELCTMVFAIERLPMLAATARARLSALSCENVEIGVFDGTCGWPEHAPFDSIVVAAASPSVPEVLVTQLKVGGRLVIPVGSLDLQQLAIVTRTDAGHDTEWETACTFVPLIGRYGWRGDGPPAA